MKSAAILGACLCCLTACKGSSGNGSTNATSSTAPTPSIQSTPEPSSNPDIGGDVDTSGGTQMKDGEIVLTKLNVKNPNNLDCNGYKEADIVIAVHDLSPALLCGLCRLSILDINR